MKIAIAGYGLEGEQNYIYWRNKGDEVFIVDEKQIPDKPLPAGAKSILGKDAFQRLDEFDLVVRTAGLPPSKLAAAKSVWSASNEFFEKCPAIIIGVTGTKGKGTTASLIASILQSAGKTVHLVGNIGVPALAVLPDIKLDDVVVYELSSFQLWDLKRSPHIAVVLMIEPDHLEKHDDMEDYVTAKGAIRRYQKSGDICLYHPTNVFASQIANFDTSTAPSGSVSTVTTLRYAIPDDGQVYAQNEMFFQNEQAICKTAALSLIGDHNIENACAAISVVKLLDVNNKSIESGLQNFHGLPHRLKLVKEVRGVKYYDDSIATTPGSAIAALHAFSGPKVIILGGSNKGAEFEELITVAAESDVQVIAIGQNGDEIAALCRGTGVSVERIEGDMLSIVHAASKHAEEIGAVVILSPAAASFDMFKSYEDRGNQFIKAVQELG